MKLSVCTVLSLFLLLPSSGADDRLVPGKPLTPSDVIVSDAGAFALGFFSPSNSSTPARLYLGIWYNGIPERTVVWVANRDTPITVRRSSSSPTLAMTNTSNLVLFDADRRVAWAANASTTNSSSASDAAGTTATLTNDGNLVLRSPNGAVLWQSFDHPTDTLLPEMKLRMNYGERPGDRLISWRSPSDPSPGNFSYGGDPATFLQTFVWNGSRPLWRSGVWTGYRVTGEYVANISAIVYFTVVDVEDDAYVSFRLSNGASRTRYVMSSAGKMELQSWNNASLRWDLLGTMPRTECSSYGFCGPFGYCDHTDGAVQMCKCLDGFEPTSGVDWSNGRFSQGCRRREPLRCGADGDGFLALPEMKAPDRFVLVDNRSFEECAAECSRNCSCVAYAYANLSSSPTGDPTRCLVYMGELIDTEKLGAAAAGSETLYLRLAGLPTGRKMGRKTIKIALPVLASALVIFICILLWTFKRKGKKRKQEKQKKLVLGDFITPDGFGAGSPSEGIEFSGVSFSHITTVTNNFDQSFLIGQGGFGKVYKAKLDGREVAIKRLSRDSEQGIAEFRNEVILIAKLQHRNFVRFLGCCIEGDEKLLIFEYMPNKSLDALLFSSTRTILDWPTRFNIIKGVAKGLLYLHEDSRMKIIHRDLKASNILLDEEMKPKIADFGMARMFNDNQQNANTKRVVGTYGYMAPEYALRGIFSVKSDVYSFGVLALEVVSGVKISSTNRIMEFENLLDYAWNLWNNGNTKDLVASSIVDTCVADEALLCIHLGLLCVQDNPSERPLMSSVVFILENGSTTLPAPKKPVYFAHKNNEVEQIRSHTQSSKNSVTVSALEGSCTLGRFGFLWSYRVLEKCQAAVSRREQDSKECGVTYGCHADAVTAGGEAPPPPPPSVAGAGRDKQSWPK
ncbi:hypothetical protein EJB05_43870, partial [Eragrostis curvula]